MKNTLYIVILKKTLVVLTAIGLWSAYFLQPVWMVSKYSIDHIEVDISESFECDFEDEQESFELSEASWNEEDPVCCSRNCFVFKNPLIRLIPQISQFRLSSFRLSVFEPPAMC